MLFCVSCATRICCFAQIKVYIQRRKRIRVAQLTQKSIRCLHSVDILQNGTIGRRRIWIKSFFFSHKMYSHSFIKLWLNPWCHMDYFTDLLATFLDLDHVRTLAVMEGLRALRFHQKYLNLCFEDEQRSYRFGTTWGWVINDRILFFWVNYPFNSLSTVIESTTDWLYELNKKPRDFKRICD